MRYRVTSAVVTGALLVLMTGGLVAAAPGGVTVPGALSQLAAVRQVTARYHDVNRALADGYVPLSPCVAESGLGTMGIHYANLALASDLAVSATSPEVLLYVPAKGGPRLVGVEYFVVDVGQPAPELFGRPMDGPMVHDELPPHYELHAWIWQGNPAGMFAEFNAGLSC